MPRRTFHPKRSPLVLALSLLACGGSGPELPTGSEADPDDNRAPRFVSTPIGTALHNREYRYVVGAEDPDGDPVTLTAAEAPSWLDFDPASGLLAGEAGWNRIGSTASVRIEASDGRSSATQSFRIDVEVGEIDCEEPFGEPEESPYILPFQVGRTYTLFQGYCPLNPNWGHHDWFAYDFDLAIGDTVVAARAGEVSTVIEFNEDGTRQPGDENLIYVRHEDGTLAAYVHLTQDGALVEVGDRVTQGQPIGLSGDSGNSSGPHLHFHVFRHGGFTRHYTAPINFTNADGPLDARNGLVQGASYTALP